MQKQLILSNENIYQVEMGGELIDFVCKSKLEKSGAFGQNLPNVLTLTIFENKVSGASEVFVDTSKKQIEDGKKIYPIIVDGKTAICSSLMGTFVKFFARPKYVTLK